MRNIILLLLIITGLLWFWGLKRAATLFTLKVRKGRIVRSSGTIPPRLMADIADIVERAGVVQAKIKGLVKDGKPVLSFNGEMSPSVEQQMRNVVGQFSTAQIRQGSRP